MLADTTAVPAVLNRWGKNPSVTIHFRTGEDPGHLLGNVLFCHLCDDRFSIANVSADGRRRDQPTVRMDICDACLLAGNAALRIRIAGRLVAASARISKDTASVAEMFAAGMASSRKLEDIEEEIVGDSLDVAWLTKCLINGIAINPANLDQWLACRGLDQDPAMAELARRKILEHEAPPAGAASGCKVPPLSEGKSEHA